MSELPSALAALSDLHGLPLGFVANQPSTRQAGPMPLGQVPAILRRSWRRVLIGTIIIGIPLAVLGSLAPRRYEAATFVRVDTRQAAAETQEADIHISTDAVAIKTQVDVLKAPALARVVARDLDLADIPEFGAARSRGAVSREISVIVAGIMSAFGIASPPLTPAQRQGVIAGRLLASMEFVNDARSYVIGIEAKSRDPALAARIANTYASVFLDYTRQQKVLAVARANSWFDQRLGVLRSNLATANMKVQSLRAKTGLIQDPAASGAGGPVTVAAQQMAQLNSELISAEANVAVKDAALGQLEQAIRTGGSGLEAAPAVVQSPMIAQLLSQQASIDGQVANLEANRGANYPGLQDLLSTQHAMRARLGAEIAHVAASVKADAQAAHAREDMLRTELERVKAAVGGEGQQEAQVSELQSQADAARAIYMSYLNLYEQTTNQVGLQQPDAALVSAATPPAKPAMPTPALLSIAGVVVGLVLSAFLAVRRHMRHAPVRTSEDVESLTGLPTFTTVPLRGQGRRLEDKLGHRTYDAIAQLRAIVTRPDGKSGRVIMVSSALPGEGKTYVAASLARSCMAAGLSTLVIDCDAGKQAVAAAIGHEARSTTEFLKAAVGERAQAAAAGGVMQIVSASMGTRAASDVFATPELEAAIVKARDLYDIVILDTPAVLLSSEARVLATRADSVLMVVRWMETPAAMVIRAVDCLTLCGARVSGVVLNGVVVRKLGSSESTLGYLRHHFPAHFSA